jgi:hypothetical protein
MDKTEIVIYQPEDKSISLEVRVEDETVWLTQSQIAKLMQTTAQNITMHIRNIYAEEELEMISTCKDFLHVQSENTRKVRRTTKHYNLDVIISVGYRVKSKRGTQFRIWATKTLKYYLLKGYVLNQRIENLERKIYEHDKQIESLVRQALPPEKGIFFDGQIFDAWKFVSDIIRSAKNDIILIDNYIDESVLLLLSKRDKNVSVTIYTGDYSKQLKLDIKKYNTQYRAIRINEFNKSHDRFIIIDYESVYHLGASLKDLGKKWFAFSKIDLDAREMIRRLL